MGESGGAVSPDRGDPICVTRPSGIPEPGLPKRDLDSDLDSDRYRRLCGCREAWTVLEQTGVVMDWGEFNVVEATDSDTSALLSLRDDAARWLLTRRIEQWRPGEIPYSWERGGDYSVFVLWRGEDLVGTVTILWDDPVIWGEQAVPAGYVHNLIVARPFGGQGLGLGLLQWAEDYVAESGRSLARLDCGAWGRRLRDLYESVGYRWVRDQQYPWLEPNLALSLYEKVLRDNDRLT
jgi:GNAT superfamily N-acetyltransferase